MCYMLILACSCATLGSNISLILIHGIEMVLALGGKRVVARLSCSSSQCYAALQWPIIATKLLLRALHNHTVCGWNVLQLRHAMVVLIPVSSHSSSLDNPRRFRRSHGHQPLSALSSYNALAAPSSSRHPPSAS